MKKTLLLVMTVIASAALLVSATVWEGVTDVVSTGDLPGGSFSIATNSFPRNTIVDITNLENGKMVRVKVVSGLETTGLLATLSRNAADSINLRGNSTCRIRMTQPSDDIAFSHYRLGPIAPPAPSATELDIAENGISGVPVPPAGDSAVANNAVAAGVAPVTGNSTVTNNTAAPSNVPTVKDSFVTNNAVTANNIPSANDSIVTNNTVAAGTAPVTVNSTVTNNAVAPSNVPVVNDSLMTNNAVATSNVPVANDSSVTNNAVAASNVPAANNVPAAKASTEKAVTAVDNPAEISIASGKLSMLPSEERPPENAYTPLLASSAQPAAEIPATAYPPSEFSPFSVPLISSLEPNKWYVQLGVYTRPDHVEDEINRIGTAYPLAIQNVGTDTNPMFRMLIGPLNQGESGAMLQRFKSIGYTDAFVRHN